MHMWIGEKVWTMLDNIPFRDSQIVNWLIVGAPTLDDSSCNTVTCSTFLQTWCTDLSPSNYIFSWPTCSYQYNLKGKRGPGGSTRRDSKKRHRHGVAGEHACFSLTSPVILKLHVKLPRPTCWCISCHSPSMHMSFLFTCWDPIDDDTPIHQVET